MKTQNQKDYKQFGENIIAKIRMKRLNNRMWYVGGDDPGRISDSADRRRGYAYVCMCVCLCVWNFRSLLNNKRVKPTRRVARRGGHLKCLSVSTSVRANYHRRPPSIMPVGQRRISSVDERIKLTARDHRRDRYIFVRVRATDTISIRRRCQLADTYISCRGSGKMHRDLSVSVHNLAILFIFSKQYINFF